MPTESPFESLALLIAQGIRFTDPWHICKAILGRQAALHVLALNAGGVLEGARSAPVPYRTASPYCGALW